MGNVQRRSRTSSVEPTEPQSPNTKAANTNTNSGRMAAVRCSFAELNELALRFETEIEIEEILMKLFCKGLEGEGSWVVVGYNDETTLSVQASGTGGLEEMVEVLANDEVQYCLVRIQVEKDGVTTHRDVFIFWSGPNVSIVVRGKRKTHLGAMQKILRPFHADLLAYNKELLTEDVVRDRSHPLSGSHVIE